MIDLWIILFAIALTFLSTPAIMLMFWFDSKITPNPYLRLQANFECVFGLFFTPFAIAAFVAPGSSNTHVGIYAKTPSFVFLIYCVNCLLLSFPAMCGRRTANKALFYLAWPRILLPCVGWFFSFFAIRYYILGMRLIHEGKMSHTTPQPPRQRW